MDDIKLPAVRPSNTGRQDIDGLVGDVDRFLPKRPSRQAQKREQKALEEARIRVIVLKGRAVLEKMAVDYRFAAKRYELEKFIQEVDYYDTVLLQIPQSKAARAVAKQAVEQFVKDLYLFIWEVAALGDEQTTELLRKELYPPEEEEEQDWLKSLGVWLVR